MECKYTKDVQQAAFVVELIETLWNVNENPQRASGTCTCELIETLWNVNKHGMARKLLSYSELIETLWNVNGYI